VLPATVELQQRELGVRRHNAARLRAAVEEAVDLTPVPGPDGVPAGHLRLPVLVEGKGGRRLASRRAVRLGVTPGYPKPLHALPQVQDGLDAASGADLQGSERLAEDLYTLPTHGLLRPRDLEALTRLLRDPGDGADPGGSTPV
jgi:dTDP-4-amino-4,6-dideoxygalactose transaminase